MITINQQKVTQLAAEAILAQIAELESSSMMNRGSRELMLRLMEKEANNSAAILASVPAYVRFKALDEQIRALRAQL